MSKKSKKAAAPPLSPAAYIRKRARNLPIYECLINDNWEETKIAQIIVSRKHTNGNVTSCFYLVDLLSQGVKDTFFKFNITESDYREMANSISEGNVSGFKEISYALAHNIIYAADEYADDLGFESCKDFISTTRYMLDEDNDEVEFIEIECGMDGKPAYVQGVDDSPGKIQGTISHLESRLGKGNYTVITQEIPG